MKSGKLFIFILLISCFPLIDIFSTPNLPHTSDGAMHLARIASFYKEFSQGQFPVRWASQFNYGYGTPIFNFFHPLPYLVSLPFIGLGTSLVNTLKISFSLTYLLAGVFMLLFTLRYFKDEKKALLVTVMYQYAPFRLVDMLVRGSLGSLYSYAILPLVLFAIIKFQEKRTLPYFLFLSISTALLPLSHNIIGFVFFGVATLFVLFTVKPVREKIIIFSALVSGLCQSAFFIIPAIIEHKYTYGYLFTKDLFFNHFPPFLNFLIPNITNIVNLRTAEVSVQFGLFHVIAIITSLIILFRKTITPKLKTVIIFGLVITFVTVLFMQPITKPLWENVAIIRQFQFPWRLLSVICFTSSFLSVSFFEFKFFRNYDIIYFLTLIVIVISTIFYWVPYQGYQKVSQQFFWDYPLSTNYFGEINSIWMAGEPSEYPKNRIEFIAGQGDISNIRLNNINHLFNVSVKNKATLLDRTQFYPGWKVAIDKKSVPIEFQDQNYRGLITFRVAPGIHQVQVSYAQDKLSLLSNTISVISSGLLVIFTLIYRKKYLL
jgi:hypothetical protein